MVPTTVFTCTVVAGLDLDVLQRAGGGRGNFGVNLVGGDFEQRLVALDFFARLLQPLGDGSFENRFPHLGHDYICRHSFLPRISSWNLSTAANLRLYRGMRRMVHALARSDGAGAKRAGSCNRHRDCQPRIDAGIDVAGARVPEDCHTTRTWAEALLVMTIAWFERHLNIGRQLLSSALPRACILYLG